ncbi:MAG: amino acid--tRNA ligase-related protein [bacterium]|nr:amino acid--tRNA ligase-related protein [bacterium]
MTTSSLLENKKAPGTGQELQSPRRMALIRVWDAMFRGARRYVESQGFIGVHNMPQIVGVTGACENIDTLFKLDYFGKQAYLAQSDQLYLELITPSLKKVYAEIQSFRMEPEADDRHLCQFSLFEIEHVGGLDELIGNLTGIVKGAAEQVAADCAEELALFGRKPEDLTDLAFKRITYTEAVEALKPDFPDLEWGDDLKANHERLLTERFGPMFLTHYPLPIKFFNMKQNAEDPRLVNSTDLLLPKAGESAGAAEREHELETIERRLKTSPMYHRLIELGGKDEDFAWYLDAHRDKDVPLHSGAGVGMARVAQFILGLDDIRDAVPFLLNSENLL